MSTAFVETPLETQLQDLAAHIAKLKGESEENSAYILEIQALVNDGKTDDVIAKFALESAVLLESPEREFEAAYNLLIIIAQSAPPSSLPTLIDHIIDPIVKDSGEKYTLKQKTLSNLYNSLPMDSPLRYGVFKNIVVMATKHEEIESIVSDLVYLEGWVHNWGVGLEKERELYLFVSEQLNKSGEEKHAYEFLLKYLSTYEDATDLSPTTALAERAVTMAIKMENFFSFENLLQIKAISALNHKSKHYDLLLVFLNDNLTGYQKFTEANKDFIASTNLDAEANIRKMRLLSLASLGSENLSRDLKYSQIAAALQIPQEEVEMWVIDVIRAGLVEAKLNQLTKTVIVHRSIVGVFGKEQWKQLSDKLNGWKQSLTDILTVVSNAKLIAANQGLGGGGVAEVTMQTTTSVEVSGQ